MLTLQNINLQFGSQILFEDLNFSLFPNQKIGLIGKNGSGKTSLFNLILRDLMPDQGEVEFANGVQFAAIEQEIKEVEQTAFDYVLAGHQTIGSIFLSLRRVEKQQDFEQAAELYQKLDELQGFAVEAETGAILHGLGFTSEQFDQPIQSFSGGWRMRLSLARCLLAPSNLLLLDEPTNHLDIEAQFWLEEWLSHYQGSVLVISHDRDFLDSITTHTLVLENKQARLYQGNYSAYEVQKAEQMAVQEARYQKQRKQIAHLQSFIDRFRAKATKAKQVQSRVKMMEKMPQIAQAHSDSPFSFEFFNPAQAGDPLINFDRVGFAYPDKQIFTNLSFSLSKQHRIGLLGMNGAGKSTLVKLIASQLEPETGEIIRNTSLNIGYFAQHQLEMLDGEGSPLTHLEALSPVTKEVNLRTYLGGFGFSGDKAKQQVKHFSGGEKARLSLALIVWQKPNLLLLDEPTNHLDIEMREAMTLALQNYEGALLVIAHDRHLLRSVVDEFWLVSNRKVISFDGDLDDYHTWLKEENKRTDVSQKKQKSSEITAEPNNSQQKELGQLEKKLEQLAEELTEVDNKLAESAFYQTSQATELGELQEKRKRLQQELETTETHWFKLLE